MIGRTNAGGGGGGGGLNFRVIGGTSAPINPKENDIWVNTSQNITSWDFSATEPYRRSKNKNFICHPYSDSSCTKDSIEYTVNNDGSITANGTASATSTFYIANNDTSNREIILVPGTYTLSGCPSGGSSSTYWLRVSYSYDNWASQKVTDEFGGGVSFVVTANARARVFFATKNGVNLSNIVVKPQIEQSPSATSFVKGDATGQVWISTGTSSLVAFNAVKKNGIEVYPISAKQYIGGAWVDVEAKSYQDGVWVDWKPAELVWYENGVFNTEVFGENTATVQSDGSFILYRGNSIATKNPVDISDYSIFEYEVTTKYNDGPPQVTIKSASGANLAQTALSYGAGVYTVDVSAINEPVIVYIQAFGGSGGDYCCLNNLKFKA